MFSRCSIPAVFCLVVLLHIEKTGLVRLNILIRARLRDCAGITGLYLQAYRHSTVVTPLLPVKHRRPAAVTHSPYDVISMRSGLVLPLKQFLEPCPKGPEREWPASSFMSLSHILGNIRGV
jgi:hypothetical protein